MTKRRHSPFAGHPRRLSPAGVALVVFLASGSAGAEAPSTSLPLCWAPEAARVGAWTSYEISFGGESQESHGMKMEERVALVGRARGRWLIESQSRMAHLPGAPLMVMQAALNGGDTSGKPQRLLVQIEDGQPLDASAQQKGGSMPVPDFIKANQGRPRRKETIRFDGKPLEATVLEARDARGMLWRAWCTERVQPLGVVRLEMRGEQQGRKMVYEMKAVATGGAARARVVGRPHPYSDQALFQQMSQATKARTQSAR